MIKKANLLLEEMSKNFNVPIDLVRSKSRKRMAVAVRHAFWYYSKMKTGLTLVRLGEITGGHDYSTVCVGLKDYSTKVNDKDILLCSMQHEAEQLSNKILGFKVRTNNKPDEQKYIVVGDLCPQCLGKCDGCDNCKDGLINTKLINVGLL